MPTVIDIDLAASGLKAADIGARPAGPSELATVGVGGRVDGYVIPYFKPDGELLPFYRVKLIDHEPKYKQPKGSINHLYFPRNFEAVLRKRLQQRSKKPVYVVLTEGEKKAVTACKHGIPTVAVGGVYSWRNRTLLMPSDTKLEADYGRLKQIKARLSSSGADSLQETSTLAFGMHDLITLLLKHKIPLVIIFDSDEDGVKLEVQKAAALLGYELRHRGLKMNQIRQVILPVDTDTDKMGLDDFIMQYDVGELEDLIQECLERRSAFPRHPNPKEYLNTRLLKGKLNRREAQDLAASILCELDAKGKRLHNKGTNSPYYFDETLHTLMPAGLLQKYGEPMHESAFGKLLYREYGLSVGDTRVITWLATQFTGEEPIEDVHPNRIIAHPKGLKDCIAMQISDSHFVIITPDPENPIKLCTNGSYGLLFEQNQVEPLDGEVIFSEFQKQLKKPLKPLWRDVLEELAIAEPDGRKGSRKDLATLLFYCSPFLYRWRGTQLPVELVVGEAGSGKSSLYALRLGILTGRPNLRNMPNDIKDWHASVSHTGGLHVMDNAKFTNKDLQQRISDEICRIVTEPYPHIEMRQLYTTSTQLVIPVGCVFAMTSIEQPFHSQDIIQRAAVLNFEAIRRPHDGDWVQHQLEKYGGRLKWFVHHLLVLHKFLKGVVHDGLWDTEYQATHRLAHYEQCLYCMGEVLNLDTSFTADTLLSITENTMSEADWILEGLKAFAESIKSQGPNYRFGTKEIVEWAGFEDDYATNQTLTNTRRLGKYIKSHRSVIEKVAGIQETDKANNRQMYRLG